MIVGIDARSLETAHKFRGIGQYCLNFTNALAKIDKKNHYVLLCNNKKTFNDFKKYKNFSYVITRKTDDPSKYNWLQDQLALPKIIKKNRIDIVHFLDQLSCPIAKGAKTVVTVHDLFQIEAKNASWQTKIKFNSCLSADKIITVSNYSKQEIIHKFKVNNKKISVIYNGYDNKQYNPQNRVNDLKINGKTLSKNSFIFLYSGSYGQEDKRKNLDFLIKVFSQVAKKNTNAYLVMTGKEGVESTRLKFLAEKLGIKDKVIFSGFLTINDLAKFFASANCFVFPSLKEGFGIPPLEAMASGCPVISSDATALPEVVGNAGILIDPQDSKTWVNKMNQIIADAKLREEYISKGLLQAKNFSWEKNARETLEVYEKLYQTKN